MVFVCSRFKKPSNYFNKRNLPSALNIGNHSAAMSGTKRFLFRDLRVEGHHETGEI